MKKLLAVLAILLTITTISFANENTIGDCESIEMECIQTSLWCESGEVIED